MPALPEWLGHAVAAAMTELGEFGLPRRTFDQGAARTRNGALQLCYKHPWCSKTHTLSILLLPRFGRDLFEQDRVAHRDDLLDLFAVQALAVGCQLALFLRLAPPSALVALALLPGQPLLALPLDPALGLRVVRAGRPLLPIETSPADR